jgi:hypothetical protein
VHTSTKGLSFQLMCSFFCIFWPSGRRRGTQKIRNKKLSIALEVLSDIKHVLQEDAGLTLNFDSTQKSKTKFLVKGI